MSAVEPQRSSMVRAQEAAQLASWALTNNRSDLRALHLRGRPRSWNFPRTFSFAVFGFFLHVFSRANMQRGRGRVEAVSCQSCRSKKLRCNRAQPCSNCIARDIPCNFQVPPERRTEIISTTHTDARLLRRIERLEALIRQPPSATTHIEDHPSKQLALSPISEHVVASDIHHSGDEDSRFLENVGTREDSVVCHTGSAGPFFFSRLVLIQR